VKDILVVGAGFSGAVIARELGKNGFNVHVIDSRSHVGGNAYDYINNEGIRIHKYGPHLFHTNNERVFNYLSEFTDWIEYKHKVKALLEDGRMVTLPVNKITKEIVGEENVIDIFFRPYTKKMWGIDLEDLNPEIINRVPIRNDENEYYFPDDKFQFMPKNGYTEIFNKLLDHKNIKVSLNSKFEKNMEKEYQHIFNSMPIDEYYDFEFGELPYRSIKFHEITFPAPKVLPVTTVNFTHEGPFTRISEWKNIPGHGNNNQYTTLTYEEPCDYKDNNMERYYPVKDKDGKNRDTYMRYKKLNEKDKNTTFIGRCGLYVYIDMHQAINSALAISSRFIKGT
jgi:UDP-galactopyranose mutase